MNWKALISLGGAAFLFAGCGSAPTPSASPPSSESPAVTAASPSVASSDSHSSREMSSQKSQGSAGPSANQQKVTLPVGIISPTFGAGAVAFHYPSTVTVMAPVAWATQIQAVGAAGFLVITRKGWTGQALVAADGSRQIVLYPSGGSAHRGPRVTVTTASACVGCAWEEAAPYFSWVRQHVKAAQGISYTGPIVRGYAVSAALRDYHAPDSRSGLRVNGVAYAPFILKAKGSGSTVLFRKAQTVLPPGEHALSTLILNELTNQFIH